MPYDSALTNIGSAMDLKTGIFTAPTSGVYYFDFYFFWLDEKNPENQKPIQLTVEMNLVLNGKKSMWSYSEVTPVTVNEVSNNGHQTRLNKGDQVWVDMKYEDMDEKEKTTFNFIGMFLG